MTGVIDFLSHVSLLMELGTYTLKMETLPPAMLPNCLHSSCSTCCVSACCLCWHVEHVWPVLMKLLASVLERTLSCSGRHQGGSDTQPSVARERPGLLCFSSPPEASWPRIISGWEVFFLGLLKSCRCVVLHRGQTIHHPPPPPPL